MTQSWHLAQFNIATAQFDLDDPRMADFFAQVGAVNALAEQSSGFVWRLNTDPGDEAEMGLEANPRRVTNMSVWASREALFGFTYKSMHTTVMSNRRKWFDHPQEAYQVLWWIPAGHEPTLEEGIERLKLLRASGPSAQAFTFKQTFPQPDSEGSPEDLNPEQFCSGWE